MCRRSSMGSYRTPSGAARQLPSEAGEGDREPFRHSVSLIRFLSLLSAGYRAGGHVLARLILPIFQIRAIAALGSPKRPHEAAGSEAGMDCGTALAKRPQLNPYGKASRRVFASEPERKSGFQCGVARKSLKRLDSRKEKAWILLPPALNFLPHDLDFPSKGLKSFHRLCQVLCST